MNDNDYADTMQEWSAAVHKRYHYRCAWLGCSSNWGLGAHHIIRREVPETRLLISNGLLLCTEHHSFVESIKGTYRYDVIMKLLIGGQRYKFLCDLDTRKTRNNIALEVKTPSSDIDI